MAGNWPDPNQYPHQQSAAYHQPAPDYAQQATYQQNAGYNAAAYQQYYAQQYGAAQGYQQQAWAQGQYPQYSHQPGWTGYPNQQHHPAFQQPQYQQQHAPPSWPGNTKGVSCYNCGAKDHWAASCSRPSRSAFGQIGPVAPAMPSAMPATAPYPTQHPGGRVGPVVTKYAVPPHVAAQMKARGVQGASSVDANASGPGYGAQYPGWQQWPGQTAGPTTYQAHSGMQGSAYPQVPPQHGSHVQSPLATVATQPQLAGSPPAEPQPFHGAADGTSTQTASVTAYPASVADHTEAEEEDKEGDNDDDLGLLDIPDMPKSYGTPSYDEPKLLAKPLYALAPEWTQAGFGEVTLCEDPSGRTVSDYIKDGEPEEVLKNQRTPAHDVDPIFAVIDVNSPIAKEGRSGSRDSGKTGYETPSTFESAETLPTSIEDTDEHSQQGCARTPAPPKPNHSRSVPYSDLASHPSDGDSPKILQDKKRKHEHDEEDSATGTTDTELNTKKIRRELDVQEASNEKL